MHDKAGIDKILSLYVHCRKILLKIGVQSIREHSI